MLKIKALKFLIICYLLFMVMSPILKVYGQSEDKLGSWYIYNGFFNVSPKVELFFDTQVRTYEVFSNKETFILRPYFNYNFTQNFLAGLGLEYHKNWTYAEDPGEKESFNEFRITLQSILSQKVDRVSIQHRYRYEFRNVDGQPRQRMRYRIQLTVPINNETVQKGTIFMNMYDEIMVDTKPEFSFNQNWLYFAGGYQITKSLNFQFGYLLVSKTSTTFQRLQFFLTQKLYFYNKK